MAKPGFLVTIDDKLKNQAEAEARAKAIKDQAEADARATRDQAQIDSTALINAATDKTKAIIAEAEAKAKAIKDQAEADARATRDQAQAEADIATRISNRAVFQRCKTKLLNTTEYVDAHKMLSTQLDRFSRIVYPDQQNFFFQIIASVESENNATDEKEKDKVRIDIIRETMRIMSRFPNNDECVQRMANEGLLTE